MDTARIYIDIFDVTMEIGLVECDAALSVPQLGGAIDAGEAVQPVGAGFRTAHLVVVADGMAPT